MAVMPCAAPDTNRKAHRLWVGGEKSDTLFCAACGAFSREQSMLLTASCRGRPSANGRRALRRLWGPAARPAGADTFDEALLAAGAATATAVAAAGDDVDESEASWQRFMADLDRLFA